MKMMGWTAPALRHQGAITWSSLNATREEPSAMQVTTIGLDIAKRVFQVHGVDAAGAVGIVSVLCWSFTVPHRDRGLRDRAPLGTRVHRARPPSSAGATELR